MIVDPLILVRSLHMAATVLAAGTVCFAVLVAEPAARAAGALDTLGALRRRWTWTVWIALAVAVLSGAAWLVLVAAEIFGVSIAEACLQGGAWAVLTDTRFGQVWNVRLALALLLGLLVRWPARPPALAAAAGLIALLALVGHAGAKPGPAGQVHLAADTIHLLAAGAWLGGLPALAMLLAQARRAGDPVWGALSLRATARFSRLGMVAVAALLASGLINSWNLLGGPRDLLATDYGQWVALKIGLFAAMVGIAAVNRLYLSARLPARPALRALLRTSLAETGLGLGVMLAVGVLGTLPPSSHVHVTTEIPPDAAFVHIHAAEAMADVTIDPGYAGRATASIRVSREDVPDFVAKDVQLALDPPTGDLKTIEQAAVRQPDGTWRVEVLDIPQPGIWTVRVIVAPPAGPAVVLDAPVVIAPRP
jgi:putative copper resistance protein D